MSIGERVAREWLKWERAGEARGKGLSALVNAEVARAGDARDVAADVCLTVDEDLSLEQSDRGIYLHGVVEQAISAHVAARLAEKDKEIERLRKNCYELTDAGLVLAKTRDDYREQLAEACRLLRLCDAIISLEYEQFQTNSRTGIAVGAFLAKQETNPGDGAGEIEVTDT